MFKNWLKNFLINKLSPYYRMVSVKPLTVEERRILTSSEYNDFKRVLFKAMSLRINENIDVLVKGAYRSDTEKGNYQGAIRSLGDIIEMTTRLKEPQNRNDYVDIMKELAQKYEDDIVSSD